MLSLVFVIKFCVDLKLVDAQNTLRKIVLGMKFFDQSSTALFNQTVQKKGHTKILNL